MGSGVPWREGFGRRVSGEIVYVYAFFRGLTWICQPLNGQCFGNPNPYNLSRKYGSTPPICTAARPPFVSPCFPGFYASHLYCNTPPICTAVRPHLYGSAFGRILGVGVTGTFLTKVRGFEKGLAETNRELARGHPSYATDSAILSASFSYSSLRRMWTQFCGTIFAQLGPCRSPTPLPPTPLRNL